MKWFLRVTGGLVALAALIVAISFSSYYRKPRFPWERLVLESAALSSSVLYNPYADYPPAHRFGIGVGFKEMKLDPGNKPDAPSISYTVDLGLRGWRKLPGVYKLDSSSGSDFWLGEDNLGPVILEKLEIRQGTGDRFEAVMDLDFRFEEAPYRPERKRFVAPIVYRGLGFIPPTWTDPTTVKLPQAWGVPSVDPHWSDEQVRTFLKKYVDLDEYEDLTFDRSGDEPVADAKPKIK